MEMVTEARPEQAPGRTRAEVAAGWRVAAPACVAVVPLGLALGVLTVHSGLNWWWAPVLAAVVFAGSLEFLLVGMLAAVAPLGQIAATALLVNFRHAFYAFSFPLHRVHGRPWKVYSTFALTDEAFALTASPAAARWSRARILAVQASFHTAWVGSVTAGACVGTLIPPAVVGLDFAATALFVVLAIDGYRVQRSIPVPLVGLACALVAMRVAPSEMLMVAMGLFLAALVGAHLVASRRGERSRADA